jgi:prolyl-tRNA synthetase
MKVSQLFVQTLREAPGDAKLKSHALLLRGGYVKSLSSGVFSLFPMGRRVIRKIEALLRTEMDAIGGQEMELPLVHPKELWEETKRYSSIGSELLRFKDRSDHEMVLAMTHEEAVTDLVRGTLNSYKQLPFMLYQLRIKFRDEARARGGLIRVKEFTMKDAYSFHKDEADLDRYYEQAYQAYVNVFNKVDIKPIVVQSDSGIMGGKVAHEFMLENADGEDYLIICRECGYQANAEIADFKRTKFEVEEHLELEEVSTPNVTSIEDVAALLNVEKSKTLKSVFFEDFEGQLYTVITLGHLEISEIKLKNFLKVSELLPASSAKIAESGMLSGFASPIGVENTIVLADESVFSAYNLVGGANKPDLHLTGVNVSRDIKVDHRGDFAQADTGCQCPKCDSQLEATRGIEIGNIFKLGTKFSEDMGANFLDESGKSKPAVMGCYGIGVGRLMASVMEQNHDDWGPIWPKSIAPYQVHLVSIGKDDEMKEASQKIYDELVGLGFEVLWDDRNERPGVKFKDADLWGIPVRVAIGGKALKAGKLEWKLRTEKGFELIDMEELGLKLQEFYK